MKRFISIILIVLGIGLIGSSFLLFNDPQKEKDNKKEEQEKVISNPFEEEKDNAEPIMVFKDITFTKTNSYSKLEIYKNKYILTNKKLYDLDGKILFDFSKYNKIEVVNDEYINADNDIYNFKGELIFEGKNYNEVTYQNNYFVVKKDNKYGVFDLNKKEVLKIEYSSAEVNSDNCISLSKLNNNGRNLFYVYDIKDKKIYGPYIVSSYFTDEVIIVEKYTGKDINTIDSNNVFDSKTLQTYQLNIKDNKEIRKKELDDYSFMLSELFNNKYIIASKFVDWQGYRDGIFDLNLKEVIPFEYEDINIFEDKYILLTKNDNHKLLSKDLKEILSFKNSVSPFFKDIYVTGNLIEIQLDDDVIEYYDSNGKLVYNKKTPTAIYYIGDNKYILDEYENEKCLYIDTNNNNQTKEIDYDFCDYGSKYGNDLVVKKVQNGKELYNNKLEKKSQSIYGYIEIEDNFLIAQKDKNYIVISYDEKLLVDKQFKDYDYLKDSGYKLIDEQDKIYYFSYK